MWLARQPFGELDLFQIEPVLKNTSCYDPDFKTWQLNWDEACKCDWTNEDLVMRLDPSLFPEVTFENSPVKVSLLIEK